MLLHLHSLPVQQDGVVLLDVLEVHEQVLPSVFSALDGDGKRRKLGEFLHQWMVQVAKQQDWPVEPIDEAFAKSAATDFRWRGQLGKGSKEPQLAQTAWLVFEFGGWIDIHAHIERPKDQVDIPVMHLPGTMAAVEGAVGGLEWTSSTSLRISHRNRRDWWTIDLVTRAVDYHSERVLRHDAHGQFDLGMVYEKGELVPRDRARALYWLRLSAEQGFKRAQAMLQQIEAAE